MRGGEDAWLHRPGKFLPAILLCLSLIPLQKHRAPSHISFQDDPLHVHTKATWPARDDRRAPAVWLGIFWIFIGFGFGFDLKNYLHESPPVPVIVHVHAVVATLWLLIFTGLVLLVEIGNVKLHRTLGWFAAYFAISIVILAPWAQVAWQVANLHTPDALPPEFLSIAFTGPLCFAILLPWGVSLRRNPAAHRRVLILSTIAMTDPGFARLVSLFVHPQTTIFGQYLFFFGGTLFLMLLMLAWDWHKGRLMKQFLQGAGLILAVDIAGTVLFFTPAWQSFARGWITSLARH